MTAYPIVPVRSSSWARLFGCAHAWEAVHILGMRSPSSFRAHLGTSIHASTAVYDEGRMNHEPISIDDAAGVFVDMLHNPREDVSPDESIPMRQAEEIGLLLHTKYCTQISPRYQYKAVELRPDPLLIEVPEHKITIELTGALDRSRARDAGAGISISDLKTGAARVDTQGVAKVGADWIQLGLYELLAEHSLGENIAGPAEIIGLQTTKQARIGTAEVPNARRGLIGTEEEPGLIQMAGMMLSSGVFPPNPSDYLCSEKYCVRYPVCKFHN